MSLFYPREFGSEGGPELGPPTLSLLEAPSSLGMDPLGESRDIRGNYLGPLIGPHRQSLRSFNALSITSSIVTEGLWGHGKSMVGQVTKAGHS